MQIEKIKLIAKKWRNKQEREFMKKSGYVIIFENKVTGWRNELRNAEDFEPDVYAISTNNDIFITCGGNDKNGAKAWVSI